MKKAMKLMALSMAALMAMSMGAFAGETEGEVSYDFAGGTVYGIYKAGAEKASYIAGKTLRKVYKKVGFYQL